MRLYITEIYTVGNRQKEKNRFPFFGNRSEEVNPLGLGPRTHTLKVYCSTNWATESNLPFSARTFGGIPVFWDCKNKLKTIRNKFFSDYFLTLSGWLSTFLLFPSWTLLFLQPRRTEWWCRGGSGISVKKRQYFEVSIIFYGELRQFWGNER